MNWNDYLPGWVIEALEHIAVLWEKGHYVKAGGWVTLAGLAIASCVILFWLAVCALLDIFLRYSVEICVVVGVPVGLWLAWKRRGKGTFLPHPRVMALTRSLPDRRRQTSMTISALLSITP